MSKQSQQHEHELYIIEYTFSTGEVWRSCRVPGCRYNIGEGKHPAIICKTHTKDADVLPELDGVIATQFENDDDPEPRPEMRELSVEDWTSTALVTLEADEELDEEQDEEQDDAENDVEGVD